MPYISIGNRMALDPIIDGLVKRLRMIECRPGDCNYTVTRVVLEALRPGDGAWDYHTLSDAVRVLRDAATEIERRLLGPYEDTVILKNGDLLCFDETFAHKPLKAVGVVGDFFNVGLGVPHKPCGHECCCDRSQLDEEQDETSKTD